MRASKKGHFEIVKYLVENGADINFKDKYDRTALDFVKLPDIDKEIKEKEIKEEIIKYLKESGAI